MFLIIYIIRKHVALETNDSNFSYLIYYKY